MPLLRIAAVVRVDLHVGARFGRRVEYVEVGSLVVGKRELVGAIGVRALARAEDERLGDGSVRGPRAHIRARGADSVSDVEREHVALRDKREGAIAVVDEAPLLHAVAKRRALPHVRAGGEPAIGNVEHEPRAHRGDRVVALGVGLDVPLLGLRVVAGPQAHVGATRKRRIGDIERIGGIARSTNLVDARSEQSLGSRVGNGREREALCRSTIDRVGLDVRTRNRKPVGNVEREARKLGGKRHRSVRRARDLPLLGIVAERRALPHVRARSAPAVGDVEHLASRDRGDRVVAIAHRLDAPPLEERAVRGGELDVRARVELRAGRGEHRLRVRGGGDHVHALEGFLTCGFPFTRSSALACSSRLRGGGCGGFGRGRRSAAGIRLRRCCDLGCSRVRSRAARG